MRKEYFEENDSSDEDELHQNNFSFETFVEQYGGQMSKNIFGLAVDEVRELSQLIGSNLSFSGRGRKG